MKDEPCDREAAIEFVETLGFPQYAALFKPANVLGVHFDVPDSGAKRAIEVIARHRRSTPSRTEAEVVAEIVAWLNKLHWASPPMLSSWAKYFSTAIQSGAYRKQESEK